MALRVRRIDDFFEYGAQWFQEVWIFEFHQSVFQKSNIGWPQLPPTENLSNISEKLDF